MIWHSTRTRIQRILIPSSVKVIGQNSFEECQDLQLIQFQDDSNLKMIISHAFYGCSIQSMIIPQKVKTIEKYD